MTSKITNNLISATTQAVGDSSTNVATTAFVQGSTLSTKLPTIGCTQATGALTISASSMSMDFRSTTLTSGAITTVLAAPANLVIPSGATLGSVTTVSSRIIVIEINNAGTAELAVVPLLGGTDLSETGLITTNPIAQTCTFTGSIAVTTGILTLTTPLTGTFALGQALSGASVSSGTYVTTLLTGVLGAAGSTYQTNQFTAAASTTITGVAGIGAYSTTARTGVAYRVVGSVDAVNTAGAWGNPTLVQGAGGNALTSMSSLGYGQTWQLVTGSRAVNTTYYNTTGKPIVAAIAGGSAGGGATINMTINGVTVPISYALAGTTAFGGGTIIPAGASYLLQNTATMTTWTELR